MPVILYLFFPQSAGEMKNDNSLLIADDTTEPVVFSQ